MVRGVLLDLDGTLYVGDKLLPGVPEAMAAIERAGLGVRFVTNITSKPRDAVVARLAGMGLGINIGHVFSAPCVARDVLMRRGVKRAYMLLRDSVIADLAGIEAVESHPEAVIIGDLGESFSYERLNRAFRFVRGGAEFFTLARNRYFQGTDGLYLDVGAFVAALEYGTRKEATLLGKPAPEFFTSAVRDLGLEVDEVIMVGDDLESDVGGGQRAGLTGVLVRTGKYRADDLEQSGVKPDAVIDSLADLPAWLGL